MRTVFYYMGVGVHIFLANYTILYFYMKKWTWLIFYVQTFFNKGQTIQIDQGVEQAY